MKGVNINMPKNKEDKLSYRDKIKAGKLQNGKGGGGGGVKGGKGGKGGAPGK